MKRLNNPLSGMLRTAAACVVTVLMNTAPAAQAAGPVTVTPLHSFTGAAGSASAPGEGARPSTPPVYHEGRLYGSTNNAGSASQSGVIYSLQASDGSGYASANHGGSGLYTNTVSAGNGTFYMAPGWTNDVASFSTAALEPVATGIADALPLSRPTNRGLWHFDSASTGSFASSLYFYKNSNDTVYLYRHTPASNATALVRQWDAVNDMNALFHGTPASVTVGRDGALYGVMHSHYRSFFALDPELEGKPFVYRTNPDGSGYEKLVEFSDATGAGYPISFVEEGGAYFSGLVDGGDGWLYGSTYSRETMGPLIVPPSSLGVIYRISLTDKDAATGFNKLEVLHTFAGGTADGEGAFGPIVVAADGNLYGTTRGGGAKGAGTLWRVVLRPGSTPAYEMLHSFSAKVDGKTPVGLTLSADGMTLYGATQTGGTANQGDRSSGTVFMAQLPQPARIVSFTASATSVVEGTPIELSWATEGAATCVAGGSNGGVWSGTQPANGTNKPTASLTVVGTNTFTLSCTGADGSTVDAAPLSVEVTAMPTTRPVPTVGEETGPLSPWLLLPLTSLAVLRRRVSVRA